MDIKIGLLGFGTVGSGVYKILEENKELIKKRLKALTKKDYNIEVKKILVRDLEKYPKEYEGLLTKNADEILEDEEIQIVCELIGGDTKANEYMKKALDKGKSIVTANKMAIFTSQAKLIDYGREKNLGFRYEAAVAGVLPIIRVLEDSLVGDEVYDLQGILNGSTNYILTRIEEGLTYDEAIKEAFDLGYLEADPTSDLEGYDPMYKLGILGNLLTGNFPLESQIDRVGINGISLTDIEKAKLEKKKIKLIARAKIKGEEVEYSVGPEAISSENPLFSVDASLNGVLLKCRNSGDIFISGAGAGSRETAISVIGDIISIIRSEYND